ncbi:MAG TPA: hypothetical protein VEK35_08520 [Roseiarcus sp.]|nr:hypothetical protein [Roseiarcus sp.]
MRPPIFRTSLLLALSIMLAGAWPCPSIAAGSYCPDPAHARPAKTPPELASVVAKVFAIDEATASGASFVRCVGPQLMGCYVGANLVCDKADRRRRLRGATAWCRDNPDSAGIPMAATGHATIYDWSCRGRRAIAGKEVIAVDRDGYIEENWREIP